MVYCKKSEKFVYDHQNQNNVAWYGITNLSDQSIVNNCTANLLK